MILRVEPDSPVPAYEQLRAQLATMISTGVLPPGTRLPSIRQLVTDLGLAANAIGRAYHELEQAACCAHGAAMAPSSSPRRLRRPPPSGPSG